MKRNNNTMIYTFLLSCLITATSCNRDSYTPSQDEDIKKSGDVTIYTTTGNRSLDFGKRFVDFSSKSNMSPNTITLDPAQKFQTMDGFGAAITGSTCYNLMKMNFSLSEYTCWDRAGKENFGLQSEETQYIIPVLKEILAINPNVKIMGSPWTPPKWMKVNNLTDLKPFDSWTSGQLNPKYYQDYGWYFVQWLQALKKEGIPVYSITVQNEPLNRKNSASMYMSWQEQQAFIKQSLGPQLKAANIATKIYAFDHNYNYDNIADQEDYPVKIYNDAGAASFIAGAAYHNYGGDKAELMDIHNQRPDKELVFTETSIGEWNDGRNLDKRLMEDMREVALGTVNNWSKGVIVWNLMLDTDKGPNREGGCQTCYGAVDINKANYKNITRNSHYYIVGHLSSVVKTGAIRIAASGYTAEGLVYSAFQNTDGSYALVLLNESNDNRKITLADGKHHFSYEVPAKSVVSYRWKN